jgi:D-serine deaminase-like pyridoxal phosphate-dependent protein
MVPGSHIKASDFRIIGIDRARTPALAIYPEIVDSNIAVTLQLLGGDANRWRPHVKTAKLGYIIKRMVERGIANFKCSTSLELATACEAGASDVLLAYPAVGANARRVRELARAFPSVRISVLVEDYQQIDTWADSNIGLFIDVNPGMNRTGIEQDRIDEIVRLACAVEAEGLVFRGLHYYDGHLSTLDRSAREAVAHQGYDRLMKVVDALISDHIQAGEVITAGTPAFPCTVSYTRFNNPQFIHRASPGTIVYNDCTSLAQLASHLGYRPAAIVVSTVVSHPSALRVTCDAGHKTVSADAGAPTCAVIGRPDLLPLKPSEEHLPFEVTPGSSVPSIGEILYLVPRHVCPTVNNFDHALIVEGGQITGVERVTARGRETPL